MKHYEQIRSQGNWLYEQVQQLRKGIQESYGGVSDSLIELQEETQPASLSAAASRLYFQVQKLCRVLDLDSHPENGRLVSQHDFDWLAAPADDLGMLLRYRLLMFPQLTLEDDASPTQEDLAGLCTAIRDSCLSNVSIPDVIENWKRKKDFRFVDTLLDLIADGEDTVTALRKEKQDWIDGTRKAFIESVKQTEEVLEKAVLDGVIEEQRSEYGGDLEEIQTKTDLNFRIGFDRLHDIEKKVAQHRKTRLNELESDWQSLKARLDQSGITDEKKAIVNRLVSKAMSDSETRVLEECFARLEEVLRGTEEVDEGWLVERRRPRWLSQFINSFDKLSGLLRMGFGAIGNSIRSKSRESRIGSLNIPAEKARREEIFNAFEAWRLLKQAGPNSRDLSDNIERVLRYLQFNLDRVSAGSRSVTMNRQGRDWILATAAVTGALLEVKGVPQFGSRSGDKINVLCVWEKPSAEHVVNVLHESGIVTESVLVLYFSIMTLPRRSHIAKRARQTELSIALLDDALLLYLSQEPFERLRAFLCCALPFSAGSPYAPFNAGDVPPEMFFGRETMARELMRTEGSCIVFGGRQLGKSALLTHVQRNFHNPEQERFACVEDIDLVGDPLAGQPTDELFGRIRDGLKHLGLISSKITTEQPKEIIKHVMHVMHEKADRRIIFMFDEADDFLDADASDGFRVVTILRQAMRDTNRRFKVVFAGLHNVQRFQGIPNQSLAHYGTAICVGPLEPKAAEDLIRIPLEVLGFGLHSESSVLRILSYTNYHAGLIQYFCQQLLKTLHQKPIRSSPPFIVDRQDVERVYLDPQVRERIRERFEWTIDLDKRYKVIALSLIVDQMDYGYNYARAYSPREILELADYWWHEGLSAVGTEEIRGLLDEMRGLGVLVRNEEGLYRLRSPNLVRSLGSGQEILDKLIDLAASPANLKFDADSHHELLIPDSLTYSPLTHSQARALAKSETGVGLVFGSEALDFRSLPTAIQRFVPEDLEIPTSASVAISQEMSRPGHLSGSISDLLKESKNLGRIIAFSVIKSCSPESIGALLSEALNFCGKRRSQKTILRILFLLDQGSTWEWLQLDEALRGEVEVRADAFTVCRRWDLNGIRQWLRQARKMDGQDVCEDLLKASGGWGILIKECFSLAQKEDDIRPFAEEINREVCCSGSDLNRKFLSGLGLAESTPQRRVIDFIAKESPVPVDLLTPEMIPDTTAMDCERAVQYLVLTQCCEIQEQVIRAESIVRRALG